MTKDEIIGMLAEVDFQFFGKQDWDIFDKYEAFAKLVAEKEREACAEIADRLRRIYRETEEAHYRLSPEPFKPSKFKFDFAELRQAEAITHAIRARSKHE